MHLRIAAGAMLSAGLVIGSGGGGIAVADSDSGSSTGSDSSAETATGTASPSHGPTATIADSLRKAVENSLQGTVQTVTGALDTLQKPGQLPSNIPPSPKTTFGGSPTVYGSTGPLSENTDDVTPPPTAAAEPDVAPVVDLSPALETPAAPIAAPANPTSAPSSAPIAPASPSSPNPQATAPLAAPGYVPPNPFLAASNPFAPFANALNTVAGRFVAAPVVLAGLPTSTTPVADVLTYFQSVLTSVGDASTSLSQLPTDLVGLFGIKPPTAQVGVGASTGAPARRVAAFVAPTAPMWSALPQSPYLPAVDAGPALAPVLSPPMPLDVTTSAVASEAAGTGSAQTMTKADQASDVLSTVQHVIGAFVATVSLTALAAVALPGLLGLLSTCAAGIRVGYRQAKAGTELPDTVISRFVGSGPIGVVRGGAQVEMRMRAPKIIRPRVRDEVPVRALTVVRSEASSTSHLLDQAV